MKTRGPLIKANAVLCDVSGELHASGLSNTGFMRRERWPEVAEMTSCH